MGGPLGPRYLGGGTPISMDEATQALRDYVAGRGKTDLVPTEIMEFERNFYAEIEEKSTGVHAFELLVDKNTGAVYPEMGPNMMWNTKYGMMSSMMGSFRAGAATADMPVGPDQAKQLAQQYLDRNFPGSTTEEPDSFYGYHTVHTVKDGRVTGMLSVQGYTGSVWYHSWHGPFVQMKELE